jgi:general secretion pathway protein K
MSRRMSSLYDRRRGFATFLVIWVLALTVVFVVAVQRSSFRQASGGREALALARAQWAARAGVEAIVAKLEYDTENPNLTDAFAVIDDMAEASEGSLEGADYLVVHTTDPGSRDPGDVLGPADAHARLNINVMSPEALMLLPYMTQDVADSIADWTDDDDDVRPQGAEIGQYQAGEHPYEPRNALFRSMAEVELVAGVEPWYVRGEDWNFNNLLDPEEDDDDESWPEDNRDRKLDAGWAGMLTTASAGDLLGDSGLPRLILDEASESDIAKVVDTDTNQSRAIKTLVTRGVTILDLISTDLQDLMAAAAANPPPGGGGGGGRLARYNALNPEQLAALLAETVETAPDPAAPRPGKLNINSCSAALLEYIPGLDPAIADSIMLEREARANGFVSLVDLLDVPGMSRAQLAALVPFLTVRSNVYIVTSRGQDRRTGLEVEVVATVDRSMLPATITEWRVR